jgi:hypothetical protein
MVILFLKCAEEFVIVQYDRFSSSRVTLPVVYVDSRLTVSLWCLLLYWVDTVTYVFESHTISAQGACQMVNGANIPALTATLTGLGKLRWSVDLLARLL